MSKQLLSAQPPEWEWVGPLLAKMVGAIGLIIVLKNPLTCFFSNNSFGVPEPPPQKKLHQTKTWFALDLLYTWNMDIKRLQQVGVKTLRRLTSYTTPKTNMDTQNFGLEKLGSFEIMAIVGIYVRFLGCNLPHLDNNKY